MITGAFSCKMVLNVGTFEIIYVKKMSTFCYPQISAFFLYFLLFLPNLWRTSETLWRLLNSYVKLQHVGTHDEGEMMKTNKNMVLGQ